MQATLRPTPECGGGERTRTAVRGFAGLCLTSRPRRREAPGYWASAPELPVRRVLVRDWRRMALAPRSKKALGWGVGIAAILVAAVGSLGAIPSGGGTDASSPIPYSATTSLGAWQALDPGGVIPANIQRTILIPADAAVVARHDANPFGTEYDAWLWLRSALTPAEVRSFFVAALPDEGWHVESASTSSGSATIIASKAGSDGSYWEVGVKDPTPGPDGARLQVRLLQVSFS